MVNTVLESGDLLIRYPNNSVLVFNPEAVTKVSTQKYIHSQGDVHIRGVITHSTSFLACVGRYTLVYAWRHCPNSR